VLQERADNGHEAAVSPAGPHHGPDLGERTRAARTLLWPFDTAESCRKAVISLDSAQLVRAPWNTNISAHDLMLALATLRSSLDGHQHRSHHVTAGRGSIPPTSDVERLAGDEARAFRDKGGDRVGDVFRLADARDRRCFDCAISDLFVVWQGAAD